MKPVKKNREFSRGSGQSLNFVVDEGQEILSVKIFRGSQQSDCRLDLPRGGDSSKCSSKNRE